MPAFDRLRARCGDGVRDRFEAHVPDRLRDRLPGRSRDDAAATCRCDPRFEEPTGHVGDAGVELVVDASECPGAGDLAAAPYCRAAVVDALSSRDADVVRTRARGVERTYEGDAAALLLAAGRFVEHAAFHDEVLADTARRDPLRAARQATGRAGPVSTVAAETGLAAVAERHADYAAALDPFVGPTVAQSRVSLRAPDGAALADRWELETGATVRRYRTDAGPAYHLEPAEARLDASETETLALAHEVLATGGVGDGERAPGRAVRRVASDDAPVERLAAVLEKHTRGLGVLEDLFADPRVTDVFATAPVSETPLSVVVDGDRHGTNLRLTPDGAATLASRFRFESGRGFSRASPTLDAVVEPQTGERVRVAGVTAPASEGFGFAFRSHGGEAWTLPRLVAEGTLGPEAAALLSVAAERDAAVLVAGPRGAGKTTLLGALLWELDPGVRAVVVEDTPELPVESLREAGRDVQAVATATDAGAVLSPDDALRTALRLGEGALVVGEVRGGEAATLFEAMRVGASDGAVLGTIHGEGAASVRERVVADLGVPASSFAEADAVVSLTATDRRRVSAIEEVRRRDDGVSFASLFGGDDDRDGAEPTGTVSRGNSRLVSSLARGDETYADLRTLLGERAALLERLAATDRTRPDDVVECYRGRGGRA
ncbi:MAG: ATPase, T2SS/T4P/T4SS family [Haloferacaceae archaeon]